MTPPRSFSFPQSQVWSEELGSGMHPDSGKSTFVIVVVWDSCLCRRSSRIVPSGRRNLRRHCSCRTGGNRFASWPPRRSCAASRCVIHLDELQAGCFPPGRLGSIRRKHVVHEFCREKGDDSNSHGGCEHKALRTWLNSRPSSFCQAALGCFSAATSCRLC